VCVKCARGYGDSMEHEEQEQSETSEGNAEQGSGDRPESPAEGTSPPGNPEPDKTRVEQAEEDLERTKPY
jgi:hypothetical protein